MRSTEHKAWKSNPPFNINVHNVHLYLLCVLDTVIYLINNTTYIGNNVKNSATCFGSVEPLSDQIQDTVLVHSAGAHTMGSHIVYKLY